MRERINRFEPAGLDCEPGLSVEMSGCWWRLPISRSLQQRFLRKVELTRGGEGGATGGELVTDHQV